MLGFKSLTNPPPIPIPLSIVHQNVFSPSHFPLKTITHHKIFPRIPSRFIHFAQNPNNNNNNNNDIFKEPNDNKEQQQQQQQEQKQNGPLNNGDGMEKDRPPVFNLKLGELLNPDPDNLFAVGLTGLLTWASVQVLWQLFVISSAILVAALKYSFVAALLLFILITLL